MSTEGLRLSVYNPTTHFGNRFPRGGGAPENSQDQSSLTPELRSRGLSPAEIAERAERVRRSVLVESMIG